MAKVTKDKESNSFNWGMVYVLIGLFLILPNIGLYLLITFMEHFFPNGEMAIFKIFLIFFTIIDIGIVSVLLFLPGYKFLKGYFKGKKQIKEIENSLLNKDYNIYYRELPNNYGIGVNTLLIDSEIENEKDIVAVILDLCAKKYLRLEKINDGYNVTILNNDTSNLLSNEVYILENIEKQRILNIDYQVWYQKCLEDGIALGLYEKDNSNAYEEANREIKNSNDSSYEDKIDKGINIVFIIAILIGIVVGFLSYYLKWDIRNIIAPGSNINLFYSSLIFGIVVSLFLFFGLSFIIAIIGTYFKMQKLGNKLEKISFKHTLLSTIKRTKKGIEEKQKLEAFKNFIQAFGAFAKRNIEEVVLWDHYLSYAQLFGLTKEIMSSGYDKLINNNSFNIDNIDNITLNNIHIKNSSL